MTTIFPEGTARESEQCCDRASLMEFLRNSLSHDFSFVLLITQCRCESCVSELIQTTSLISPLFSFFCHFLFISVYSDNQNFFFIIPAQRKPLLTWQFSFFVLFSFSVSLLIAVFFQHSLRWQPAAECFSLTWAHARVAVILPLCCFISGLGYCLTFLPTVTILSQYFNRRRSLVTSFASTGECFSLFALAPGIDWLLTQQLLHTQPLVECV